MQIKNTIYALVICMMLLLVYLPTFSSGDEYQPLGTLAILRPEADTSVEQWTSLSPTDHYDEVDEVSSDGFSTYVSVYYTGGAGLRDFYELSDTTGSGTIDAVVVHGLFFANVGAGGAPGGHVSLLLGNGTTNVTESSSLGPVSDSWLDAAWAFTTDMYGNPWTWDMINQMIVGIELTSWDGADYIYCTQVWVELTQYGDNTTFPNAKMHFPQMPDPYGWDVSWVENLEEPYNYALGDDWLCTESGNVTDIHFWISWHGDIDTIIPYFTCQIWSNNPTPSSPDTMLWSYVFTGVQFNMSGPYEGDEGWYVPYPMEETYQHDHRKFWRIDINVTNITTPFYQMSGTIYWLVIEMPIGDLDPHQIGWKTSKNHFMDNAVYYTGLTGWIPLYDPIETQEPIDFAFVITGEPFGDPTTFPDAKMTNPQYPNATGWDVGFNNSYATLADDWVCSETGLVTGIHLWVSSEGDSLSSSELLLLMESSIISIHNNIPEYYHENYQETYSEPGDELWVADSPVISISGPFLGDEGWLVPNYDMPIYKEHDHQLFWRVDINLTNPFYQENETIYWLMLSFQDTTPGIGWKTTTGVFEDGAIHRPYGYYPVYDPITDEKLDLAFVITGEPAPEYGDNTTFPDAKMHFPQMPDPLGWDISFSYPGYDNGMVADDWLCTESGNITGIHFWVSAQYDSLNESQVLAILESMALHIYSNYPGPPSWPNMPLWGLGMCDLTLAGPYYGDEGFFVPDAPYNEHDHNLFWRVDINNITSPFHQENGTIYWLVIHNYNSGWPLGWKTSKPHFMDNAIYGDMGGGYTPIYDPLTMDPIDLAFVITGEAPLPSNSPPIQSNETPTNASIGQSINTPFVSINVTDLEGDTFNISIHGDYLTNVSLSDQANGTFTANLTIPLPYDTDIWWYADIYDSEGRWVNASYYFHTALLVNQPPTATNENPANNSNYVKINSYLSVTVTDPDNDTMDVVFYWGNGTEIGIDWNVANGTVADIYLPDYVWLSHNTEYSWYVEVFDGTTSTLNGTWNFTTCKNYDLTGDGKINYLDVSALVSHYGDSIPDATQMITLRPIADTLVTWTGTIPPMPAHFLAVRESIPDEGNTFVFDNPPAVGPELFFVNAPLYTYTINSVTLNARMSSMAGSGLDWFQHIIWDGFSPMSFDVPIPIMPSFPTFQTYSSSIWIGDPYGGAWTWATLQAYHFGVSQTGIPFMSPTLMTQFYLEVNYNTPGSEPWDIDGNGIVNYLDVSSLVSHYGEVY